MNLIDSIKLRRYLKGLKLDKELISNILNNKIFIDNYDSVIKPILNSSTDINTLIEDINSNTNIINNSKFNSLYKKLGSSIFKITNIDKIDSKLLDIFNNNIDSLIYIINNNYIEGLEYTYNNIPESNNFINNIKNRKVGSISLRQFDMKFINCLGLDIVSKLYKNNIFYNSDEYSNLFKIYDVNNYELIKDIVSIDTNFTFKYINEDMVNKDITYSNKYDKKDTILYKYFGISIKDNYYIKLLLDSINVINKPKEFNDKYKDLIDILNKIYSGDITSYNSYEYKGLISPLEVDGNNLLKEVFASSISSINVPYKHYKDNDIDIYEYNGEDFTMLVHNIGNNPLSENNNIGKSIIEDPSLWNKTAGNKYLSTSLISNKYMVIYGKPIVVYGFNKIDKDNIIYTNVSDAGIDRKAIINNDYTARNNLFIPKVNTITTPSNLIEETINENIDKNPSSRLWNEVGLKREGIMPDYIVCFDTINEESKKASMYFNIPIYLINKKYYKELPYINENIKTR